MEYKKMLQKKKEHYFKAQMFEMYFAGNKKQFEDVKQRSNKPDL